MADANKRARVSQEDVVKVLDEMDVGEIEDVLASIGPSPLKDAIANADLNIPGLLSKADRRHMRTVSKEFYQPGRKCLDAGELQAMRSETEPCKNTARVMYNPEKGIQRALMCAMVSVDKELHVDVEEGHWDKFQQNESVKCFDDNYALSVTVLRDVQREGQSGELAEKTLRCVGGYRELETAFVEVENGRPIWPLTKEHVIAVISIPIKEERIPVDFLDLAKKVQTVRFRSEPSVIPELTFFAHTSLLEVPQMPMVKTVEGYAFAGCVNLEHVGRMESVESLGLHAFACCHNLRDAPVMPKLNTIGDCAFWYCYALDSMPDLSKVTHIGMFAFAHCHGLRSVYIPENVQHVLKGVFWDCSNLSELQAPDKFYLSPDVSEVAFVSCPKLARNQSLLENGFHIEMPWVDEHLLEAHESSYTWANMRGVKLAHDLRLLYFIYDDPETKTHLRAIYKTTF